MTRLIKLALAGLLLALASPAAAQSGCGGQFQANQFCGVDGAQGLPGPRLIPAGGTTPINGGTVLGNPTALMALPIATPNPVLGIPGSVVGTLGFANGTSGTVTVQTVAGALGTRFLFLPAATGTLAVNASSPLVESSTTGNLTCPTCVTSSGGGAITGAAPIAVSGAGVVSINNGTSVLNPGTGTLEYVLPVQTNAVTSGACTTSCVYAAGDLFKKFRRSNSGSAMSDTLPASSATGMVNGARMTIGNVDATATLTLTAGSGTSIATTSVGPGRTLPLVYDLANTAWRIDDNAAGLLLGPASAAIGNIPFFNSTNGTTLGAAPSFQSTNPANAALYSPLASPAAGNGVFNAMQIGVGTPFLATDLPNPTGRLSQAVVGTVSIDPADTLMTSYGVTGIATSNSTLLANGIGVGAWGFANGTSSSIWAIAGSIHNKAYAGSVGKDVNSFIGQEIDLNIWKKAAGAEPTIPQLHGLLITGSGDSTANQGDAVKIGPLNVSTGAKWTYAFKSDPGAAINAFIAGPAASSGTSLSSQFALWQAINGSGGTLTSQIYADGSGEFFVVSPATGSVVLGDPTHNYVVTGIGIGAAGVAFPQLASTPGILSSGASGGISSNTAGTGVLTALGVNVGTAGSLVVNGGAGGTPSAINLANGTALPTTGLTGALQAAQEPAHTGDMTNTAGSLVTSVLKTNGNPIFSVANAVLNAAPTNPTGTTSTTPLMMGLGVTTCRITPVNSTRVEFTISGSVNNNTAGDSAKYQMAFGSGAGPANAATASGTTFGSAPVQMITSAGGGAQSIPFSATGIATGLTIGTTYWFDIQLAAITAGTASVQSLACTAHEV